jgi:hypothetical protein
MRRAIVGSALILSSCLVGPTGEVLEDPPNSPPEFIPESAEPQTSLIEADTTCSCLDVTIDVVDRDGDRIVGRGGTNIGLGDGRALCTYDIPPFSPPEDQRGQLSPYKVTMRLIPRVDFIGFRENAESTHTISIFATDAPRFLGVIRTGTAADCGRVASDGDAGLTRHAVIEHRWAIHFNDGLGDCPGLGCEAR